MSISMPPETKQQLVTSIKRFFDEKLDEEIGELKADLILDYVLKEIAPSIYNRAIADAQGYFMEKAQDLDGSCFEKEFGYWK